MVERQKVFEEFEGQTYGPRNGFEPRDFQVTCLAEYADHVKRPAGSGTNRKAFVIYGGTGCGKTKLAAVLASHCLNVGQARQIVVVVPNHAILRKTRADFLKFFGIELAEFDLRKHRHGIGRIQQGYILTYAAVMKRPGTHKKLCEADPTLVILDEIHHLGDRPEDRWGAKSLEAFGGAAHIIGLTGTPYRLTGIIPFVEYEEACNGLLRFKPNFKYSLGRAVADGCCRKPSFDYRRGDVQIRWPDGREQTVSFDEELGESAAQLRLAGAVKFGSPLRKDMLREALAICREEGRKVVIFLGGDTCAETVPTEDALHYLPSELAELGYGPAQYEVVTGDDRDSPEKIDGFAAHPTKWILVSIQMVSEGADLPAVSAAIFLTSVTAKQTTVQRIGRALRMRENDPHIEARIFMFGDRGLRDLGGEIEGEIEYETSLRKRREAEPAGNGPDSPPRRAEAIGVGHATLQCIIFNGVEYSAEQFEQMQRRLKAHGLPCTYRETVLRLMMEDNKLERA